MKKFFTLFLMLTTMVVFAEHNPSLLANNTFGIFQNAQDGAFEVNENGTTPNFSSLKNPYFFGGLTNFDFLTTTTEEGEDQNIPFMLGYFNPGEIPTSYLLKICIRSSSDEAIENGKISKQTALVSDSSETSITSEYNWITEESNQVFSVNEALDLTTDFQFIFHTGILNMGTVLSFDYLKGDIEDPLSWAEENREIVSLYNYDKMAGSPPPQAALDYTKTETWTKPDSDLELGINLPVYVKTENIGHFLDLGFSYSRIDDSLSHSVDYSEPVSIGPTETFTEIDSSTNDILTGIDIEAEYTISLPALIPTHRSNFLEAGAWFNYRINIADDMIDTTDTRNYVTNMLLEEGSRNLLQSQTTTTTSSTLTLNDSFNGGLSLRHPLYFGLSETTILGIVPELSLSYEQTPLVDSDNQNYKDYIVTNSQVTSVKTDSDGDGVFEETITTTKTFDSDGQGLAYIGSALFKLPMAIRISPEEWPFEFTIASLIEIGTDLHWLADKYDSEKTTVETMDENGTITNTTSSQESGLVTTTSERFWSDWQFTHTNKLGFTIRFPKYVSLDLILNSSNLFDFDNLTIQVVIALP